MTYDAPYTARPESWKAMTLWDASRGPSADCILELCARVERLERKQRDSESASQVEPAPSTPAGLVSDVAALIADFASTSRVGDDFTPAAKRAILAVADWCDCRGMDGAADWIRQEVSR